MDLLTLPTSEAGGSIGRVGANSSLLGTEELLTGSGEVLTSGALAVGVVSPSRVGSDGERRNGRDVADALKCLNVRTEIVI